MSSSSLKDSDDNLDSELEFYILNKKNKLITKKYVNGVLKKYGVSYKIKNLENFQQAVTHTSYLIPDLIPKKLRRVTDKTHFEEAGIIPMVEIKGIIPLQTKSYERPEFLGDSVLHLIFADYIYHRFKDQQEGFMTTLRTRMEDKNGLAKLCKVINLNEYILISKLIEINGGRDNNVSILEDSFEAFICALFEEAGFDVCKKFVTNLIESSIDISKLLQHNPNYKDILLRLYHQKKWDCPKYFTLNEDGPDHKRQFMMGVKDNMGRIIGQGSGVSKRKGEQKASRQALLYLGELNEDESDSDNEKYENYDSDWSSSDSD